MDTIQELKTAVSNLSREELSAFRTWFAEFDADEWDRQLEDDIATGRLDWLAEEARADNRAGRCTDR